MTHTHYPALAELLREAAAELIRLADDLRDCCTVPSTGEWGASEQVSREEYERLTNLANRLLEASAATKRKNHE